MAKYRMIDDLTSDVMFEAYGKDLKEVFENSAEAMFSVICQLDKVEPRDRREVTVEGEDERDLLLNWLQELIAMVDTEEMFFSRFEVKEISPKRLRAVVRGEGVRPEVGETVVKAVTYYNFSLERAGRGWMARVAVDI